VVPRNPGDCVIPIVHASKPEDEVRDPLALGDVGGKGKQRGTPLAIQSRAADGSRTWAIGRVGAEPMEVDAVGEGEFVYDVFVRQDVSKRGPMMIDGSTLAGNSAVGTLYIPEGAEGEWGGEELWVGGDEEAERVETDDEDENAEDYYGADYPEEEDEEEGERHGYGGFDDDSDGDEYGKERYDWDGHGEERESYVADYDDHFQAMSYR
jgi:uncharacterized protein DUF1762